jgi:hypothetical protein
MFPLICLTVAAPTQAVIHELVPAPKSYAVRADAPGLVPNDIPGIVLLGGAERPILPPELDHLPTLSKRADQAVVFELTQDAPENEEGYVLDILNGAHISSRTATGLFYGAQTLAQLIQDSDKSVRSLTIKDWPSISYRAVQFDTKHHLDTIDHYYDTIDQLASYKINAIIWEIEDKLDYRRQPNVGADNAISIEELQAITRYAAARNIEISPLIQGLGHASFILKHDEYADIRDKEGDDWAFCPINERTYEVQFDLYRDAIEAFPGSRYLHIGGDEVRVGESELAKASGKTDLELHLHWLNRVSDFLVANGRIPIMWDDMPLKLAGVYNTTHQRQFDEAKAKARWAEKGEELEEMADIFSKDAVYMRWNYSDPGLPGNKLALDYYADNGFKAMAATAAQTRWPVMPRNNGNVAPIHTFCKMTADSGLEGILCTAWDDDSPHMELYWRGWMAFAEFSWSPDIRSDEEFQDIFVQRMTGVRNPGSIKGKGTHLLDMLEMGMNFWDTALLKKGVGRNVCNENTLKGGIKLPTAATREEWQKEHNDRITNAKVALNASLAFRVRSRRVEDGAARGRHYVELTQALNELQMWSSEVIFQLSVWCGDPSDTNLAALKELADGFEARRDAYHEVFQQTRHLNNPKGYKLDMNHHTHQANSSNGPDWMTKVEEIFAGRLSEWVQEQTK